MAGVIIAGTNSGVGKTTISMGIMKVLSQEMIVQPYKVGPDYIDTAYHTYITNRKSRNLDSWMLTDDVIKYLYNKNRLGSDFAVIEGVMGLYDGAEIGSDIGSTAKIAKILKLPVVLVVNGGGLSQSIAAIVKGYADFDSQIDIKGVIFNNVSSDIHYYILKEAVETYTDVKPLGYLKKVENIKLSSRHLGLVPSFENETLDGLLTELALHVKETIDIDGLVKLGKEYNKTEIKSNHVKSVCESYKGLRVAIAKDEAFNFYYHDNLDLFLENDIEIVTFSPIHDEKLPDNIHGLMFGGGFPEVFAKELEQNETMKNSILEKLSSGIPYIAECGGLMYLCNNIYDFDSNKYKMVGWFNKDSYMTKRLQRFGYAELELTEKCIYGEESDKARVHEFHRSKVDEGGKKVFRLKKYRKNKITKEWNCGYEKGNGLGAYAHIHYYTNLKFFNNFVKKMDEFYQSQGE
ncbi:cobyrinate a,c-diamide synthase [Clostridiaceae bacterium M8S5]|nr:cobyrinate a,c-diamide synthase [Clostridiaceae bacterium M8S5]